MPRKILLLTVSVLGLAMSACRSTPSPAPAAKIDENVTMYFKPLPARFDSDANPATPEKIALGRALYYDPRLSKGQDVSCNSCHDLATFGVDHAPFSTGHKHQKGGRNAPTVYNAAPYVAQFWDGRAPDLEAQAKGPILNPVEMGMPDEKYVLRVLRSIPGYAPMFAAAFPGEKNPITYDNVGRAVGAFERGLVTPSRFDRFLAGDANALSDTEKAGLLKFRELGCTTCHNGVAIGGTSFQRLGQAQPWPLQSDPGRFKVTHDEKDRMVFKVPTLRNIAKTGPWFHDGSQTSLPVVIRTMGRYQLGRELADDDVAKIQAFLESLTGDIPKDYIAPPTLPPSGPDTPAPDRS